MVDTPAGESLVRRLRHRLGPWLDRLANALWGPTTQVYPSGYVATVDRPIETVESALSAAGFSWDPLSTYHYTPTGSSTDGSWAYRSSWLTDRQVHVVLFAQGPDRTDVYAHEEYNWLRHPVKHANEADVRREDAVAAMQRWLDARDLPNERDPRTRRAIRHAIGRLGDRLRGRLPRSS